MRVKVKVGETRIHFFTTPALLECLTDWTRLTSQCHSTPIDLHVDLPTYGHHDLRIGPELPILVSSVNIALLACMVMMLVRPMVVVVRGVEGMKAMAAGRARRLETRKEAVRIVEKVGKVVRVRRRA